MNSFDKEKSTFSQRFHLRSSYSPSSVSFVRTTRKISLICFPWLKSLNLGQINLKAPVKMSMLTRNVVRTMIQVSEQWITARICFYSCVFRIMQQHWARMLIISSFDCFRLRRETFTLRLLHWAHRNLKAERPAHLSRVMESGQNWFTQFRRFSKQLAFQLTSSLSSCRRLTQLWALLSKMSSPRSERTRFAWKVF